MKIIRAPTIFDILACQLRRLLWSCAGLLLVLAPAWATAPAEVPIRISFPDSLFNRQFMLLADWRAYLQSKLNRRVEIVTGQKISNSVGLLYLDKLDFAWVTDYPNFHLKHGIRLLAVPLSKGQPYFTSYLIVPASDTKTSSLLQLNGAIFALSDPSMNGSYAAVGHQLSAAGADPARFFSKVIFTGSHRDVIKAVALGVAHAGEVDSGIWDSLAKAHPELASQTRVVAQSLEYGAPPIVVNDGVSPADYKAMQLVLLGMSADPKGIALLSRTGLDGFIAGDEKIYEHAVKMGQFLNGQ